jgi:hypothetical protein
MRDTELYRHLLGLESPWEVSRVELFAEGGRIDVWVEHPKRTRFLCPECDTELSVYDHAEERSGVTSIPASSSPICTPSRRGSTAPSTA